jgi:hypothetical protein
MRFVMFVIDGATETASPGELSAIDAFNDTLRRGGHFIVALGIGAPSTARRFDERLAESAVAEAQRAQVQTADSLQQADEFYSGFWVIDAPNRSAAEQFAVQASRACNRKVELRPLLG